MTMTLIYVTVGVAVTLGVAGAVWSYVDTRRKYYEEYLRRKRK